tara:strand:- start:28 stop:375 length:348 start_codon:yes stop_codon:yes gene_type:complete
VADFYTEMQAVASEMMAEFKQGVVTYTPQVDGANEWDPKVSGTPLPMDATVRGAEAVYFSDLITQSDMQVTASVFDAVPAMNGYLTLDGTRKEIIKIMPIPAVGVVVAWRIFVKG